MAKLTKTILKEPDAQDRSSLIPSILTKKIEVENTDTISISDKTIPYAEGIQVNDDNSIELDKTIKWLIDFLEEGVLNNIKENPNLQLPFVEPSISVEEWFSKALKTVLNYEDIQKVGGLIQAKIVAPNTQLKADILHLKNENEDISEKLKTLTDRLIKRQEDLDNAELAKFKLEKQLAISLPTENFINAFYIEDFELEIRKILLESIDGATKDLGSFVSTFSSSWVKLKKVVESNLENKQDNLDKVHNALTDLLSNISGLYIAQRRTLLDKVAQWVSTKFEDYIFVSPEETLQLDPNIHNARGLGSTNIVEGVSYAIIRRASRQTVMYAEVKVN